MRTPTIVVGGFVLLDGCLFARRLPRVVKC